MKKYIILLLIFATAFGLTKSYGQTEPFSKWSVGLGVSTLGVKLEASTPVNPYIVLRGGVSYLPYSHTHKISFNEKEYRKYIDYDPELNIKGKINLLHANLLADFSPVANGIFHFTTGLFIGSSQITGNGILINPANGNPTADDLRKKGYVKDEIPALSPDDTYTIQPNRNGSINAKLKLGGTFKPYFGIGLGKTLPNSGIAFKFDLGLVYQGKINISSPNLTKGSVNDWLKGQKELQQYEPYTRWFPMINFQLSYRIL